MDSDREPQHLSNSDTHDEHLAWPSEEKSQTQPLRISSVYDAVAGRLFSSRDVTLKSRGRTDSSSASPLNSPLPHRFVRYSTRRRPLSPGGALQLRRGAPPRDHAWDWYTAHERDIPQRGTLPDSDMLKAMHRYASHYYARLSESQAARGVPAAGKDPDTCSMDETALLAFGVLMEEAGREVLGKNGELVFTEEMDGDEGQEAAGLSDGEEEDADDVEDELSSQPSTQASEGDKADEFENWRKAKRRKLDSTTGIR